MSQGPHNPSEQRAPLASPGHGDAATWLLGPHRPTSSRAEVAPRCPAPCVPMSHHHREAGAALSPGVRGRAAAWPAASSRGREEEVALSLDSSSQS